MCWRRCWRWCWWRSWWRCRWRCCKNVVSWSFFFLMNIKLRLNHLCNFWVLFHLLPFWFQIFCFELQHDEMWWEEIRSCKGLRLPTEEIADIFVTVMLKWIRCFHLQEMSLFELFFFNKYKVIVDTFVCFLSVVSFITFLVSNFLFWIADNDEMWWAEIRSCKGLRLPTEEIADIFVTLMLKWIRYFHLQMHARNVVIFDLFF